MFISLINCLLSLFLLFLSDMYTIFATMVVDFSIVPSDLFHPKLSIFNLNLLDKFLNIFIVFP